MTPKHDIAALRRLYALPSPPQAIAFAAHERTILALMDELSTYRIERAQMTLVLETFRQSTLSASSLQPIYRLADTLCGPMERERT